MINISGFGFLARLVATNTFPQGVSLADFADDADPLDAPDFQAADTGMGLNGDLVIWTRPQGIEVAFNVIPTSQSDVNLDILLNANRVGKGKTSARDVVSLVLNYPSGMKVTMNKGIMVVGSLTPPVQQSGRLKSRQYRFRFENVTKTGVTAQEFV